jgi:NAD(P)-dependent dehydrogenase (short-subunit alcohol dehydrogenase family)
MLQQGKSSIINTASMSGIISNTPQPQSAYNASKGGVIMLTKSLAGEWAKRGRASQFRFAWVYQNRVDQKGHVENRLV